jgi:rare lipoprotein A
MIKKLPFLALLTVFLFQGHQNYAQIGFCQNGKASYYGKEFHGKKTASGEKFNMEDYTGAHPKLPFNAMVKVTNLSNKKWVIVRINDRGPFTKNRIIDISKAAAEKVDIIRCGTATVKIEVVGLNGQVKELHKEENTEAPDKNYALNEYASGYVYNSDGNKVSPEGYGVQISSFSDAENVADTYQKLTGKGYTDIFTEVVILKKKRIFRIIVGSCSKETDAKKLQKKLQQSGFKGFIKKYQ